jgi:hypothetical protein
MTRLTRNKKIAEKNAEVSCMSCTKAYYWVMNELVVRFVISTKTNEFVRDKWLFDVISSKEFIYLQRQTSALYWDFIIFETAEHYDLWFCFDQQRIYLIVIYKFLRHTESTTHNDLINIMTCDLVRKNLSFCKH